MFEILQKQTRWSGRLANVSTINLIGGKGVSRLISLVIHFWTIGGLLSPGGD